MCAPPSAAVLESEANLIALFLPFNIKRLLCFVTCSYVRGYVSYIRGYKMGMGNMNKYALGSGNSFSR